MIKWEGQWSCEDHVIKWEGQWSCEDHVIESGQGMVI